MDEITKKNVVIMYPNIMRNTLKDAPSGANIRKNQFVENLQAFYLSPRELFVHKFHLK